MIKYRQEIIAHTFRNYTPQQIRQLLSYPFNDNMSSYQENLFLCQRVLALGFLTWVITSLIFFQTCERAESSKSCNLIGSECGRYFTILPSNPWGIVGSLIHKFVCCLWMSKNRHFQAFLLLKLGFLLVLAGKSEFYYSDKKSEGRMKQVSEENR